MQTETINAVGVVTVTAKPFAKIYNEKGVALTDHALGTGSKWRTDIAIDIDHKLYYRVATDQYLSSDDVSFVFA